MWTLIVIDLVVYCVYGAIWGVVVNKVVENKGYSENWFWWGFFFSFFALIVALTKPQKIRTTNIDFASGSDYVFRDPETKDKNKNYYLPDGWKCPNCGKMNASYVGTCGCGCDKSGTMPDGRNVKQTEAMSSQVLYCASCGKQMDTGAKFCRYCGAKVE